MLTFTDEQRAALIKMRQDWQAAEQARDALDRAKLPISSRSFDAVPSHGLPKGLDDRLTRIEALQAALERAVRQAAESLSLTDEALKMDEIGIPEFRFFCAYYRRAETLEEAAKAANITMQRAQKLRSLVEFSADEKPKTRRKPWFYRKPYEAKRF